MFGGNETTEAEKGKIMHSLEELLSEDANRFLRKLDNPQQRRQRFDHIIERLQREGLDQPPPPEDDDPDDDEGELA